MPDSLVSVRPYSRLVEDDEVVIGFEDADVFLVLPPDAVELLDRLAAGETVEEARRGYQEKYKETPDVQAFLEALEQKGVVRPLDGGGFGGRVASPRVRYHFARFPRAVARRFFGRPALIAYGSLIALAVIAIGVQPSVIPGWHAFVFEKDFTLMTVGLIAFRSAMTFLHELAHLVAARAVGISSRLGIGNRLWVPVAETEMTGIWTLPRRQRYLPLVAGPLVDGVSASVLVLLFFATGRGWISLPPALVALGRAILLATLLALLWQCFFFVRTDFYYVLANFFRCKNLLGDTEAFLRNQVARLTRRGRGEDQSQIPAAEMRVVRGFSIIWIAGRLAAAWAFCFILVPSLWNYGLVLFHTLRAGYAGSPYAFVDALIVGGLTFVVQGLGLWLWIRNSSLNGGRRHGLAA